MAIPRRCRRGAPRLPRRQRRSAYAQSPETVQLGYWEACIGWVSGPLVVKRFNVRVRACSGALAGGAAGSGDTTEAGEEAGGRLVHLEEGGEQPSASSRCGPQGRIGRSHMRRFLRLFGGWCVLGAALRALMTTGGGFPRCWQRSARRENRRWRRRRLRPRSCGRYAATPRRERRRRTRQTRRRCRASWRRRCWRRSVCD